MGEQEISVEPLGVLGADDPVTCAIYAREKGLLDTPGWKRFKRLARREKKLIRMANQAKLRSFRTSNKYKYGHIVPNNYAHAMRIDQQNGNTKWQDSIVLEMAQLDEYDTFKDIGHKDEVEAPARHQRYVDTLSLMFLSMTGALRVATSPMDA